MPSRCPLPSVLPIAVALLAWISSASAQAPARPSPFGALVLTTNAQHVDGRVHVRVTLTRPSDGRVMLGRATPCFTAPPALEARFDGEPMFLMGPGGPRWAPQPDTSAKQSKATKSVGKKRRRRRTRRRGRRGSIRGERAAPKRVQVGCAPVQFGLAPRDQAPDSTVAEVAVRWRDHTATMQVKDLFVPRRLALRSAKAVRPGDRVEVEWTPATDVWIGRPRATAIYLRRSHALSLRVPRADLSIQGSRFAFEMPSVPPGAARIELGAGSLRAHPPVVHCDGPRRCQSGALPVAAPVDAMILP